MLEKPTYPPGTMLADMTIDIYAGKTSGRITIMHDKPFHKELVGLEFDLKNKRLNFIFENEKKDLGAPLRDALVPFFTKADAANIVHVDLASRKFDDGHLISVTRL